ncbi:glycerol acyltransferase [Patiriisocius marinistellae]|uniref:Glycerol acyltransferase n=1 Tax=Patiriisocius marinistellae TaxID=2494560 RepID=A0A5J4FVS6_9FLAO|nr:MMPL family transporter [Patiriisocius marinistellae]GEQ85244.1 glycerol acyltransferase [Patiriisocius marinistellae]
MDNWWFKTFTLIKKNKLPAIFIAAGCIFLLIFLASKIKFEEDITKILPATEETRNIQKILKSVNFTDKIIVNISRKAEGNTSDLTQYATSFLDSLNANLGDFVKDIQGQVNDQGIDTTLDFVYNNLPQFLNNEDYKNLESRLMPDSIQAIIQSNYRTLVSPSGIIARKVILKDPLGLSYTGLKKLQKLGVGDDFKLKNGFVISKDEQNLLLFITPQYLADDAAKNEEFSDKLYELQNDLNASFYDEASSEYFGAALIAVANAKQIKHDIQFTIGIAITILMVIFILFYKKLIIPFILFTPTILGALLAVSLLYLIRTEISAISLGIGSVLLGVTLDYSLHILTHIRNNEGVESLYKEIAKPILISSLTTALAFLCLLLLDSQALQDLGIFAAVSVIGAAIFALLFIPQVYKVKTKAIAKKTSIDNIANYKFHHNKWLITGITGLLIMSAFTYNKVTFNNDLATLNYEPSEILKAKRNLDALTNLESKSVYAVAYGNTTEAALKANDSLFNGLKNLESQHKIMSFSNLGALVQSKESQAKNIKKWNLFWTSEKISNLKQNMISSGNELGFKPSSFDGFYGLLQRDFKTLSIAEYGALSSITIEDFISEELDITTVTSVVKLEDEYAYEVKAAFADSDSILIIDRKQMNESLLGSLRDDFNKLIWYSMAVVLLLLLLYYRSFSLTIVTMLPVFLTWGITVGVMGILGIEFNIFNIIISTFIFGLGIDYSIFITNGLLQELKTGQPTLGTHKTSILLSVLTTILGIGVLIFAKHPALYTISIVSIIGIFSAMLLAFTLQPLLFVLFIGSKRKRPITLRYLVHSVGSFLYFGIGGLLFSLVSPLLKILPVSKKKKMGVFHNGISKLMKSVLYTNPFVKKNVLNTHNEDFKKPAFLIANHTSFLDILAVGMLTPKLIFLVNDWVYNSPVFGRVVKLAGFYPVSKGIDEAVAHLQTKVAQGYSLIAFPEGTRSTTNKVKRFHKGSFFLAEKLGLDIIPVIIHGNSEVLPKNSFIIKDGSITVKILKRIPKDDTEFGPTYSEKAKQIGAHFRDEFQLLRDDVENANYFHKLILEEYRYKGSSLHSKVKMDLRANGLSYKTIAATLPKNSTITHISNSSGQLDFLLALDSANRKITTRIENSKTLKILRQSYLTLSDLKLNFVIKTSEILNLDNDVLIINSDGFSESEFLAFQKQTLQWVVLIDSPQQISEAFLILEGFEILRTATNLSIFKKIEQ